MDKKDDNNKFDDDNKVDDPDEIFKKNFEKFESGDNVPNEQRLSKGQQINLNNTLALGTGTTYVEDKIQDVTSKVVPTADKEGTETEAPASSKPIIEEVVTDPATGSLVIICTIKE